MTDGKRQYNCKFCGGTHSYPAASRYCESNPDAEANRLAHKAKMKVVYVENDQQSLIDAGRKKHAVKISRTSSANMTKLNKEDPRFAPKSGEDNPMYGKTQSKKQKDTLRAVRAHYVAQNQPKFLETQLNKYNIPRPLQGPNFDHPFFQNTNMDSNGFVENDDSSGYFDEFDPFG